MAYWAFNPYTLPSRSYSGYTHYQPPIGGNYQITLPQKAQGSLMKTLNPVEKFKVKPAEADKKGLSSISW